METHDHPGRKSHDTIVKRGARKNYLSPPVAKPTTTRTHTWLPGPLDNRTLTHRDKNTRK